MLGTLLLQTIRKRSYTAYRIAPFLMTLSDLQGRAPIAAVDKISTDIVHCTVPLG